MYEVFNPVSSCKSTDLPPRIVFMSLCLQDFEAEHFIGGPQPAGENFSLTPVELTQLWNRLVLFLLPNIALRFYFPSSTFFLFNHTNYALITDRCELWDHVLGTCRHTGANSRLNLQTFLPWCFLFFMMELLQRVYVNLDPYKHRDRRFILTTSYPEGKKKCPVLFRETL